MKRIITVLIVLMLSFGAVFASNIHFVFDSLELNPNVLGGICPTVFTGGVGFNVNPFGSDKATEIQVIAGGGLANRNLSFITEDVPVFTNDNNLNVAEVRYGIKLIQDLNNENAKVYLGYDGRWEKYLSPETKETIDWNNSDFLISETEASDKGLMSNVFYFGALLNNNKDTMFTRDGFNLKAEMRISPSKKNLSFLEAEAQVVYSNTLFQSLRNNGRNKFSAVLVDRAEVSVLKALKSGDYVPAFAREFHSLGRKVRGFETFSYTTAITAVNNFEVRLASPEFFTKNLFARLNLFIDAGIALGNVMNTTDALTNKFIASTGAVAEVSVFDFANIGAQFSYILKGSNGYAERAFKDKTNLKMHIIFMLDY